MKKEVKIQVLCLVFAICTMFFLGCTSESNDFVQQQGNNKTIKSTRQAGGVAYSFNPYGNFTVYSSSGYSKTITATAQNLTGSTATMRISCGDLTTSTITLNTISGGTIQSQTNQTIVFTVAGNTTCTINAVFTVGPGSSTTEGAWIIEPDSGGPGYPYTDDIVKLTKG